MIRRQKQDLVAAASWTDEVEVRDESSRIVTGLPLALEVRHRFGALYLGMTSRAQNRRFARGMLDLTPSGHASFGLPLR